MQRETRHGGRRTGNKPGTRGYEAGGSSINYKDTETPVNSRPRFYDDVEKELYDKAEKSVNEEGETTYKSAISGKFFTKDQMSIDHIVDWETYCSNYCRRYGGLNDDGTLDKEIFKDGYNDLTNLRIVNEKENSSKGKGRVPGSAFR